MALFSRTKKTTPEEVVAKAKVTKPVISKALPTDKDLSSVIIKPRLT